MRKKILKNLMMLILLLVSVVACSNNSSNPNNSQSKKSVQLDANNYQSYLNVEVNKEKSMGYNIYTDHNDIIISSKDSKYVFNNCVISIALEHNWVREGYREVKGSHIDVNITSDPIDISVPIDGNTTYKLDHKVIYDQKNMQNQYAVKGYNFNNKSFQAHLRSFKVVAVKGEVSLNELYQ